MSSTHTANEIDFTVGGMDDRLEQPGRKPVARATEAGEGRKLEGGASKALAFLLAGNATATFVSLKTGARYTYKVSKAKDAQDLYFVSLLTGSSNVDDFSYLGIIRTEGQRIRFMTTRKSCVSSMAVPSAAGFSFVLQGLAMGMVSPSVEIWHEGRCGRCGRKLTVPSSIASGFGPECEGKGMAA